MQNIIVALILMVAVAWAIHRLIGICSGKTRGCGCGRGTTCAPPPDPGRTGPADSPCCGCDKGPECTEKDAHREA